jgi:hypothetical protein
MRQLLFVIIAATLFTLGCRGPEGAPGVDAEGVDIVPPTIQMTDPWPLSSIYDSMKVAASAVDNVAIDKVIFTIDGSPYVPGLTLVAGAPPYRFMVPLAQIPPGWHFVAARAYDVAGNITEAPARPVRLGLSSSLSDTTITLAYHNKEAATYFTIPDSARSEAFWVRLSSARYAKLNSATMTIGGSFSDSTILNIGIWTGLLTPTVAKDTVSIGAVIVAGPPQPQTFNFGGQDSVKGDFFIVLELTKSAPSDTLIIAADNGLPPWERSGTRDELGWFSLKDRYSSEANFILSCELHYGVFQAGDGH